MKALDGTVATGSGHLIESNEAPNNSKLQSSEFNPVLCSSPVLTAEPEDPTPESNINQTIIVRKQAPRTRRTLEFSGLGAPAGSSSETSYLPSSVGLLSEPLEGIAEEKSEVSCSPSIITVEKAVATKVFFEKHYGISQFAKT
jgi:hypothetical protein